MLAIGALTQASLIMHAIAYDPTSLLSSQRKTLHEMAFYYGI